MVNKIDIKPATLISGSSVSVQILKYVDSALSEDNTYTFDANDFESLASSSNPYVAILTFGTVHTENINGSTTQCFFDGVVCSPNDAYTLAGLVEVDVTAYASGGGGYTFPSNSGNTAYVSSGGNDGTGTVGNISKPFLTADAAIVALNNSVDGTLIILSSTSTIEITDYDYTTMPYNLSIQVLCDQAIRIGGSSSFGVLGLSTNGDLIINTQLLFATDDILKIKCRTFIIPSTSQGSIAYLGVIECDALSIETNSNIDIAADVLIWNRNATVGVPSSFTYNICPPMVWSAALTQSDTDAPTADVVIENTYGESFTLGYAITGKFTINSSGNKFATGKTFVEFGACNFDTLVAFMDMMRGDMTTSEVVVYSVDSFLIPADSLMAGQVVTIKTYL